MTVLDVQPASTSTTSTDSWWEHAACHKSYDLRFHSRSAEDRRAVIREYCLACPVADICAYVADLHRERGGVWGGVSRGSWNVP